ncbi:heterokaryon incompatibility protein-domain-containing protein [Nemania abortiva]|nr:heterokaryon incompatibility protein-domain-containing protein [Nemania abortiva]
MAAEGEGVWRQHLYLQTRLKEKNGRIRLLTIQPRQYTATRSEAPPDAIHCFLRLAELKEHPHFTAVSHRWHASDAVDETKSVLVNGAAVPVSTGLFEVLSQLQNETETVVVWIDALCINHADEDEREKSVQVAQLAQIFATAEKTFIWLGTTADRSDEAMKVLRRLSEEQLTLSAYVANWTPQLGHQLAQKILPSRFVHSGPAAQQPVSKEPIELQQELESLRAPLKALMERDYWMDLWSLVELCLSGKGLVVCGGHGLALDHFSSAARALDHIINHLTYSKWLASATNPATPSALSSEEVSNLSQSAALRILARRDDYRKDADSWLKSPDNPLFGLLSRFFAVPAENRLPLRIGNARDRVYALACLATDVNELGATVDYSKDVNEVYAETSAAFLQKHPRVLQLARGTQSAGENENENENENEKQTSWAIDWENVRLPPSYLGLGSTDRPFNACGPADIRFYRAETGVPGQISLKAGVVDKVQEVGTIYRPDDELGSSEQQRTYLAEIRRFWEDSTASLSSPYFAEQAAVALAKIPVGDIEAGLAASSSSAAFVRASSATVEGYKRTVEALFPAEDDSSTDEVDEGKTATAGNPADDDTTEKQKGEEKKQKQPSPSLPYLTAMARMAGRRPFRSHNGYVGLGPADLAVGDTIAIPYGSAVPFAFRRSGGGGEGDEATTTHRLVGEVYVFGIMDGEFMKVHRQETVLRVV